MKSKGTIDMSEVMSVHRLMNQAGNYAIIVFGMKDNQSNLFLVAYPFPALKAGEKGYFFQVSSIMWSIVNLELHELFKWNFFH